MPPFTVNGVQAESPGSISSGILPALCASAALLPLAKNAPASIAATPVLRIDSYAKNEDICSPLAARAVAIIMAHPGHDDRGPAGRGFLLAVTCPEGTSPPRARRDISTRPTAANGILCHLRLRKS